MPGYAIGLILFAASLLIGGLLIVNTWAETDSGLIGRRWFGTLKVIALVTAPALLVAALLVLLALIS